MVISVVTLGVVAAVLAFADLPQIFDGPKAHADLFPGMTVEQATAPDSGLLVTSLRSGGSAERIGVAVGDEIEAIDRQPVRSLSAARSYLRKDTDPTVHLRLLHNDGVRDVTLARHKESKHGT